MNIQKSMLKTMWYEDKDGNQIECDDRDCVCPDGADYYVTRWPLEVREVHSRFIKRVDVDRCKHKRKWIKRTGGWVDGIKGRECQHCNGTQLRKTWQPWGRKWDAEGSREIFVGSTHIGGNGKLLVAMANSGDYTLTEAILAYSMACERCMNVLWNRYLPGEDGYAEYSEEWKKCGTSCQFCRDEATP